MGRLAAAGLLAAMPLRAAAALQWLPLDQATAAAKSSKRIILLYLRTGGRGDGRVDEWVEHLDSDDVLRELLPQFVLATAVDRGLREPKLEVLDPGGQPLADVVMQEYGNLAAQLGTLHRFNDVFVKSAQARDAGHVAESLVLRANALLYAGGTPTRLLADAVAAARAENNQAVAQDAELGLGLIASRQGRSQQAVLAWRGVAAHPALPELAARAWLLIGNELSTGRNRRGALEAYQNAWRVAPKNSAFADAARRLLEMSGAAPEAELQATIAAGGVKLLYPHRAVLAGVVDFNVVAPANAARVEFYVDDARVAERDRPPFSTRIDLGAVPRIHNVRAVAFDADGASLGEDSVAVNERAEAVGVEIVAPRESVVESNAIVEVQPHVPGGGPVQSIDLYWNEQKLTTLTSPPFRYPLTLPSPYAFGYVRAVAHDPTGATAEDAKVINSAGGSAEVRVDAVELYVDVQDRNGHSVPGLTARDFVVKEDGAPVAVEVHNDVNEPITVGIAVDISGSMRVAMPSVMEYATEFLRHSMSEGDKTFVITFADEPQMFRPLTGDFERVSTSMFEMNASGTTALWDAVAFSLDQLRAIRGKRALLLFTDGVDTGSRTTPKGALEYALEAGVPVYAVLVYTGMVPTFDVQNGSVSALPTTDRAEPIERIAEETGGMLIRAPRQSDLPRLFQQVRDDTRGAYALTFVSPSGKKRNEMRKLSVAVPGRRGLVVRAPSAYFPR
jgi:Ca-activated chloride channel family protein